MLAEQGFIQKILFGVEGGVALSRTVPPHEVLRNVFLYINLILVITKNVTYIIIPKYMLPPPVSHFPLSLSPPPLFSFLLLFFGGGEAGHFRGEASPRPPPPPPPPPDETLLNMVSTTTHHRAYQWCDLPALDSNALYGNVQGDHI